MNKKNCIYCNKGLRGKQLIFHLKCDNKIKQEQYEMKIAEFKEFFKSKGIHILI
jgi:hypothetical protein